MIYQPESQLQGLYLNSIFGRCEDMSLVAVSYSKEDLINKINSHRADTSYQKEIGGRTFQMSFKEGSPFENYNYPFNMNEAILVWKTEQEMVSEYREFLINTILTKGLD